MGRSGRIRGTLATMVVLAGVTAAGGGSSASLHGSPASVDLMYDAAESNGLHFYRSAADISKGLKAGALVPIAGTPNVEIAGASFPLALTGTHEFLTRFALEYAASCGEPLTVTSAARPESRHLRNGSPKSVHPTGMAIDLRKPRDGRCLQWVRDQLLELESRGAIEATEEFHPPHFHVAVLPGWQGRMPPLSSAAIALRDHSTQAAPRLDALAGWPLITSGLTLPGMQVPSGAVLALAGVLSPVQSVAALAGPLTMQLIAPLAFAAPSGPMLVSALPLDSLRDAVRPPGQLRATPVLAMADSAGETPDSSRVVVSLAEGEVEGAPVSDSSATAHKGSDAGIDVTPRTYRVRRGDSLWGIARSHGTTVKALMAANDLQSKRLQPGDRLVIPAHRD